MHGNYTKYRDDQHGDKNTDHVSTMRPRSPLTVGLGSFRYPFRDHDGMLDLPSPTFMDLSAAPPNTPSIARGTRFESAVLTPIRRLLSIERLNAAATKDRTRPRRPSTSPASPVPSPFGANSDLPASRQRSRQSRQQQSGPPLEYASLGASTRVEPAGASPSAIPAIPKSSSAPPNPGSDRFPRLSGLRYRSFHRRPRTAPAPRSPDMTTRNTPSSGHGHGPSGVRASFREAPLGTSDIGHGSPSSASAGGHFSSSPSQAQHHGMPSVQVLGMNMAQSQPLVRNASNHSTSSPPSGASTPHHQSDYPASRTYMPPSGHSSSRLQNQTSFSTTASPSPVGSDSQEDSVRPTAPLTTAVYDSPASRLSTATDRSNVSAASTVRKSYMSHGNRVLAHKDSFGGTYGLLHAGETGSDSADDFSTSSSSFAEHSNLSALARRHSDRPAEEIPVISHQRKMSAPQVPPRRQASVSSMAPYAPSSSLRERGLTTSTSEPMEMLGQTLGRNHNTSSSVGSHPQIDVPASQLSPSRSALSAAVAAATVASRNDSVHSLSPEDPRFTSHFHQSMSLETSSRGDSTRSSIASASGVPAEPVTVPVPPSSTTASDHNNSLLRPRSATSSGGSGPLSGSPNSQIESSGGSAATVTESIPPMPAVLPGVRKAADSPRGVSRQLGSSPGSKSVSRSASNANLTSASASTATTAAPSSLTNGSNTPVPSGAASIPAAGAAIAASSKSTPSAAAASTQKDKRSDKEHERGRSDRAYKARPGSRSRDNPATSSSATGQRIDGASSSNRAFKSSHRTLPQLPSASSVKPAPPPAMYWSKVPVHGSVPRRSFRAHTANLCDEVLWLFGGCDNRGCFRDLWCFDTETMCWSKPKVTGDVPPARRAHSATMVNKRLFVFAGGDGPNYFNDLYIFDTISLRWTKPDVFGTPPSPRRAHTCNYFEGQLIVFGGGNGVGALNDVHTLDVNDISRLEWRKMECSGKVPIGRGYHTSNLVDGKLIVIGGSDGHMSFNDIHILRLDTRMWYQVKTDEIHNRLGHTATQVGSYLFVFGGHDSKSYTSELLTLNLVNLQWEPRKVCGRKPQGRGYHQAWLRDSRLFVHGGFDGKDIFDDLHYLDLAACAYLPQITSFSVELDDE